MENATEQSGMIPARDLDETWQYLDLKLATDDDRPLFDILNDEIERQRFGFVPSKDLERVAKSQLLRTLRQLSEFTRPRSPNS